jgi:hypothetical protein
VVEMIAARLPRGLVELGQHQLRLRFRRHPPHTILIHINKFLKINKILNLKT